MNVIDFFFTGLRTFVSLCDVITERSIFVECISSGKSVWMKYFLKFFSIFVSRSLLQLNFIREKNRNRFNLCPQTFHTFIRSTI